MSDTPIQIKPLDKQKDKSVPQYLPKIPFTSYVVASKGGGKTTLLLNLLLNPLKGKFNKIYWLSPTAKLDPKLKVLLETKMLLKKNTSLMKLMNKLRKEKRLMGDLSDDIDFPTEMTKEDLQESFDLEFLQDLIKEQKQIIENFGKKFADDILLVLDDMIENKLLNNKAFTSLLFQSRHYKISIVFISQSYFSLPKRLRLNSSQLVLFETGSEKEIKSIYQENNNGISFDTFQEYYLKSISKPYGFLSINYDNFKTHRFIRNFEEFLQ